jgi:hypothetical protein
MVFWFATLRSVKQQRQFLFAVAVLYCFKIRLLYVFSVFSEFVFADDAGTPKL